MSRSVAIIILNWNGWSDTIECLTSLLDVEHESCSIIIWDNGSSDSSVRMIEGYLHEKRVPYLKYKELAGSVARTEPPTAEEPDSAQTPRIFIIEGAMNHGFAGGCNVGIDFAFRTIKPDYIFLLNNDTIVKKDSIGLLVEAAEKHPDIGIFGPTILYYNKDGRDDIIWGRGGANNFRKYPFLRHIDNSVQLSERSTRDILICDWVSGAAMMFSAATPLRMLDSSFRFGNEDVDFCLANTARGRRTCVVPASIVWHKSGRSRRKRYSNRLSESLEYICQNMKLYGKHEKHRFLLLPLITVQFVLLTIRTTVQDLIALLKQQ